VISGERGLARLHARIRACTKCVDAGYLRSAFPIVAGKASDRVMIIGQAPGAVELTTGLPFSGRAGAELRRWLATAGIDETHLPYRTAITKCFPGKAASGAGDRRPSPPEIASARRGSTRSSRSFDRASFSLLERSRSNASGDEFR
jgi:uracil-DNA glycosylase